MQVKIMRGIPRSGKTTYVKKNFPGSIVITADSYHMVDGEYKYNPANNQLAHNACLGSFAHAIVSGYHGTIVVDNTNVRMFEIAPYYRLAEAFNYDVEIIWLVVSPQAAFERDPNKVPLEQIIKMHNNFEPLLPWWKVKIV